jgi:murein DD-endopeptidase MepM/ murein hydrolase activator NlpD
LVVEVKRTAAALGALALVLCPSSFPPGMEGRPPALAEASPRLEIVTGTIARNTTLAEALEEHLSPSALHELVEASRPAHDLGRIAPGRPFTLGLDGEGHLARFEYEIDDLRTLRVERGQDGLIPRLVTRTYDVQVATASGVINSSLFAAVTESGEDDQLALDLADIFAWDVDFSTEIQSGDSFRVAFEKLTLDGRFARYGTILSAEFVRGGHLLRAVRFDGARGPGYYAPDGTPLRKQFLRSPLKFTRISSRFSRARLHPILKTVRPHLGVDYVAPPGTPVMAAADGVVTLAGWWGGYGRTVKLRHANGYQTLYGHLSRVLVRPRQRVVQGTVIGTVGASGLATGPHLDYRMMRAGSFVNPLTVQSPPAEPIPADERAAFEAARDAHLGLLPAAESRSVADVQG